MEKTDLINFPKQIWLKFLSLVLIYLLIDCICYNLGFASFFINLLILLAIFTLCLINLRLAVSLFIPLIIFSDDISRVDPYNSPEFYSILNIKILGFPVLHIFTLLLLGILGLNFIYKKILMNQTLVTQIKTPLIKYLLIFLLFYIYLTIVGIPNISGHLKYYISDISAVFYIGTYFWLLSHIIKNYQDLNNFLWVILVALAAKNFIWFLEYLLNIGYEFGSSTRVTFESGKVLTILLILIFSLIIIYKTTQKTGLPDKAFYIFITTIGILNIFVFAGRLNWLMLIIGFLIISSLLPRGKKIKFLVMTSILSLFVIFSVFLIRPESFQVFKYMFKTIAATSKGEISEFNHSSSIRFLESLNIYKKLKDEKRLLTGFGAGGWFDYNSINLPVSLTASDYSNEELENGEFHKPHNLFLNMLLKSGLIGIIIYAYILVMFFIFSYKSSKFLQNSYWKSMFTGITGALPLILLNSWTTKMNMFIGILLAIIAKIYSLSRKNSMSKEIVWQKR